jgi:inner membrane protein
MPTILSHPAVPLAIGLGLGRGTISGPLLWAGVAGSILPDLDVVAFQLGIPYSAELGHRGFSHSLLFAALLAVTVTCAVRVFRTQWIRSFLFLSLATASHGLLDSLTNGGLGIAFLWPWSAERFFAPVQLIEVSPLGVSRFLTQRGVNVLASELLWLWLPCTALGVSIAACRRLISGFKRSSL